MRPTGYRTAFVCIAAFVSSSAFAAPSAWDGLDFNRCTHWSLTEDVSLEITKRLEPLLAKHGKEWFAVEASSFADKNTYTGICKFTDGQLTGMECLSDVKGFPIAGTTFTAINLKTSPSALPTYKCTAGCAGATVTMLYMMPYEDGGDNVDYVRAYRRFKKQCPSAK